MRLSLFLRVSNLSDEWPLMYTWGSSVSAETCSSLFGALLHSVCVCVCVSNWDLFPGRSLFIWSSKSFNIHLDCVMNVSFQAEPESATPREAVVVCTHIIKCTHLCVLYAAHIRGVMPFWSIMSTSWYRGEIKSTRCRSWRRTEKQQGSPWWRALVQNAFKTDCPRVVDKTQTAQTQTGKRQSNGSRSAPMSSF